MYAEFDYLSPSTAEELYALMEEKKNDYLLYAGGTDLLILLRAKKVYAKHVIDIKKIPGITGVQDEGEYISIGAATRLSDIESDPLIKQWASALSEAAAKVGSVQIRFKGTLGGNIQTASPAGDGLNAVYALDAEVGLLSRSGERRVPIAQYVLAPRKTAIQPGEVLYKIYIPKRAWSFQHFFKTGRRNALAISVVNGAMAIEADANGLVKDARIVLGAVAPTPIRIQAAERLIIGRKTGDIPLNEVTLVVQQGVRPISDLRASAQYRAYIAGISVKKQISAFTEGWKK
jgi:xanthine dehydrogenase FAD-binding subunit